LKGRAVGLADSVSGRRRIRLQPWEEAWKWGLGPDHHARRKGGGITEGTRMCVPIVWHPGVCCALVHLSTNPISLLACRETALWYCMSKMWLC